MDKKVKNTENDKSLVAKILPHFVAVIIFLGISIIYFSPVFDGKMLPQGDMKQYEGASKEIHDYYYDEGQSSTWTGSMFSGMPSYQIAVFGGGANFLSYLEKPMKALGSNTAGPIFAGMLMAYILFCVMGFSPTVSMLGAIAYSLSSYNIILLEAGHITKAWALAYLPLVVSGIIAVSRNKLLLGGILFSLGLALQIKSNHLQMTYYTAILCVILFIGYAVQILALKKDFKTFLKASGILTAALAIAVLCNVEGIYGNLEMARESTRGKSELSTISAADKQSSGLDKDYTFAWSYGLSETFSLMIPNIHGGASGGMLDKSSNVYKEMVKQGYGEQVSPEGVQGYTYWGDQPFTQGPVYFGAIICFLFVLGMLVIRNKFKWVLFVATIFFIALSWGRNMEWFNDLFFYYFPLYSKFRAVSSALVIPALTMVIVAVWGLAEFLAKEIDKEQLRKSLYIAAGVTGGICLIFWMVPDFMFNFTSNADQAWRSQMPDWYYSALLEDRKDLLSSDAFRSLVFIILAGSVLFLSLISDLNKQKLMIYSSVALVILVTVDLWGVDKRYLNNSKFVSKTKYTTETFALSVADKEILKDKHPSYRVLNLNNPFNETTTSYHHKSLGGYHAAKLKRYQELIEYRIDAEMKTIINSFGSQNIDSIMTSFSNTTALNMLNAKYIIYSPEQPPLQNPYALGNAWFVSEYKFVNNADEEITALNEFNPRQTLIVDKRFENELSGLSITVDSTATIELTEYKPNILKYKSKANSEQLAAFSEIYFSNGWQAYIDGQEVPHFRADWTLRAMRIPAGEHEIVFKFEAKGYTISRTITTASSAILVLLLLGMIGLAFVRKKEN